MHIIGVVVHPKRDTRPVLEQLCSWATARGGAVLGLHSELPQLPLELSVVDEDELRARSDLVVGVGGDGTVLRALRLAAPAHVPVLGVNLGRLGFLAEVDWPRLGAALEAIDHGRYAVEQRVAIATRYPLDGEHVVRDAYNDVVLSRVPGAGQAAVALHVEAEPFARYSADAVMVATPTGSTAYSFSAGGPIVSPRAEALVVNVVAPHSTFDRALVVHRDECIALEVLAGSAPLTVELDGRPAGRLEPPSRVELSVSPDPGLMVRLGGTTFYSRARRKLQLVDALELGPGSSDPRPTPVDTVGAP